MYLIILSFFLSYSVVCENAGIFDEKLLDVESSAFENFFVDPSSIIEHQSTFYEHIVKSQNQYNKIDSFFWTVGTKINDILTSKIPLVIKNSTVTNWTALKTWNLDYLNKKSFERLIYSEIRLTNDTNEIIETEICSHFHLRNYTSYENLISSWKCPMIHKNIKFIDLNRFNILTDDELKKYRAYVLMKARLSQFPDNIYDDIIGWDDLSINKDVLDHDNDIWVTSAGTTSHAHIDYQHNLYASVYGHKRFLLLSPEYLRNISMYPFHHPLSRNIQAGNGIWNAVDSSALLSVILSPGDVMYIPPSNRSQILHNIFLFCFFSVDTFWNFFRCEYFTRYMFRFCC